MTENFGRRLGRWLVRLLPVDVRDEHGVEIRQALAAGDRDRPRGARAALAYWLTAFVETARVAPRHHAEALAQDVRYAWRGFRRSPGFAIAALTTIALGTGATLAVFVVVNGVLLRPLAFPDPSQLALIWAVDSNGSRTWFSAPELEDLSTRATSLDGVAGLTDLRLALTGSGVPEELDVVAASATLFPLLGVQPHIGRLLERSDDLDTAARVVVLSQALWVRRFGSSPDVLGRSVTLNGRSYVVAGVLPRSFGMMPLSSVFPQYADAWLALQPHLVSRARDVRYLHVVGRVRAGVPFGRAREEIASIGQRVAAEFSTAYRGRRWTFDAVRLQDDIVSGVRPALLVLMGTVAMVLLIACVNVAALLLARGTGRRREMAVRVALGASRGRLVRQLLTEGFVLAGTGGGLGLLLAVGAPRIAQIPAIGSLPRFGDLSIDGRVILFGICVSAFTAVVFTLAPSLELSGSRDETGTEALRSSSRSRSAVRISRFLAGSEVALASAVLVLALLFTRALVALIDVNPGFATAGTVTARVSLPRTYATAETIGLFFDEVLLRLGRAPGVESTGAVTQLPLSGSSLGSSFTAEGTMEEDSRIDVDLRGVTPGYFKTLGIPVHRGRGFTAVDTPHGLPVAIVDEITAHRLWPGRDPVGQRIRWLRQPDVSVQVIGVVGAIRHRGVSQPPRATVYRPHTQYSRSTMYLVARIRDERSISADLFAATVQSVDPGQPVDDVNTMAALQSRSFAQPGFGAALAGALALLALALAAVGVYGLYAFAVAQRRREVGIRLAIGGTPREIERLILTDGLSVTAAGLCVGLPAAALAARAIRGVLPDVGSPAPAVLVAAAAVIVLVSIVACWIPARRASRVDPTLVLRADP